MSTTTAGGPPSLSSFLSLSEKSRGLASRGKVRQQRNSSERESRKSFILSSLDKFADDDETLATDLTTGSQSFLHSSMNSSLTSTSMTIDGGCSHEEQQPPKGRSRYMRRGSVTKFSIEDDDNASVGNSSVQSDAIVGDHNDSSACHNNSLPSSRERIRRRGSVTRYSLSEDEETASALSVLSEICTDNSISNDDDGPPPLPPKRKSATKRSSGSKFSLDSHLTKSKSGKGRHLMGGGSTDDDDASVGCNSVQSDTHLLHSSNRPGLPPLSSFRSSFTKTIKSSMNLGEHLSHVAGKSRSSRRLHKDDDDDDASVGCKSVQSDTFLLDRSSHHEGGGNRKNRAVRRGSVTKYSLEEDSQHSVVPEEERPENAIPRRSLRRRGSVTKFSLDESTRSELGKSSCHSMASTASALTEDSVDLYGDSDVEDQEATTTDPPRKERYHRRGSVTKYSLSEEELPAPPPTKVGSKSKSKKSPPVIHLSLDEQLPAPPTKVKSKSKKSSSSSSSTTSETKKVKRKTSSSSAVKSSAKPHRVLPSI